MKNISSICLNPNIKSLCIGKFDGVHIAHQELLARLDSQDGGVLVIDFDNPPYLTPNQNEWISYPVYKIPLDEVRELDARGFGEFLKQRFPKLERVIVGYDFRFGKNRLYIPRDLEEMLDVCIVDKVQLDGVAVHRQEIIQALCDGDIAKANAMLGRSYHIEGEVISGQGRGQKECVATLNLKVKDYILPRDGVYASLSEVDGVCYKSVSFVGERLSSDGKFAIETHLLETCFEAKADKVKIFFIGFLRENRHFDSLALLKEQIQKDIQKTYEMLEKIKNAHCEV